LPKTNKLTSKILKYGTLLTLKESYLFVRNFLGLTQHPFKTLRAMFREEDRSQLLLIIGLPIYFLVGGVGLVWFGRRLIAAPPGVWGFWTKSGLMVTFFASLGIFLYVGYWLWRVWRIRK
jgi:hypothetical protein